jgi:tetratricopeptide (TPR) repeat protein
MKKIFIVLVLFLGTLACNSSEELSKQAIAFYSDNNSDKALDSLLQIEEKDRTPQDWLILGNLMEENAEKSNAIYMYQKAIAVNNKYYKPYYNLANIFLEEEKYGLAIEHYKKAVSLKKDNPYLHYNLACAYLKAGNIKKAKTSLINAVTLKNDIPEVHYNLAFVYKSLGKNKIAQSYLDNYNKLLQNNI